LAENAYAFQIQASATAGVNKKVAVELGYATALLQSPNAGEKVTVDKPSLSWLPVPGAQSYTVDVATDAAFTNIVETKALLATNQYKLTKLLQGNSTYYWRVTTVNGCGKAINTTSLVRAFSTLPDFCRTLNKTNATLITDALVLNGTQTLKDLNVYVQLVHPYIADVNISLTHVESGKKVVLMPNFPSSCTKANLTTTFDDESTTALSL